MRPPATEPIPASIRVPPLVAGQWGLHIVLLVAGVGLLAGGACIQLLTALVGPLASWQMVAAQIPAFLLWWVAGLRLVARLDTRGPAALGLGGHALRRLFAGIAWYGPLGLLWWTISITYASLVRAVGLEFPQQQVALAVLDPDLASWARAVLVFGIVAAAPLGEEMVFRGLLHGWLRRSLSLPVTATLVGLVFGALHIEWSRFPATAVFVLPLAVLGAMLSWLRERPGGLWACVGLHATHNTVTLLLIPLAF